MAKKKNQKNNDPQQPGMQPAGAATETVQQNTAEEPSPREKAPQKGGGKRGRAGHTDWDLERMSQSSGNRRYAAAVPIGGIFVLLAVIGLITVVTFSIRATERLIDNSREKEMFSNLLLPVLMFDPVPFENPEEMGEIPLLRSSIWSAIIENQDKYTYSDGNQVTVPRSDVDVACARLFGPEITLNHGSFEDYIDTYAYNEETDSYYIPIDATVRYTPVVEEISRKGDVYSLTVGYLTPDNDWMLSLRGEKAEPTPSKYMIYNMKKVDDHYQLVSIQDPPEGAVPGIPQIQPEGTLNSIGSDGSQTAGGSQATDAAQEPSSQQDEGTVEPAELSEAV